MMVGTTGFEPATSPTPRVRATELRHVPIRRFFIILTELCSVKCIIPTNIARSYRGLCRLADDIAIFIITREMNELSLNHLQYFSSQAGFILKAAADRGGDGFGARLFNPTHRHAHMLRLDNYNYAMRL